MNYLKLIPLFSLLSIFCACGSEPKKDESAQAVDSLSTVNNNDTLRAGSSSYAQAYDKALALWKIPFTELDLKTSYGNAHVIVSGPENAQPLVLLHGMNASSTMWYPNIRSFSENHRVYAIDFLLEPGKSACEGGVDDTDDIMNWYFEIFKQLKLEKFSIVGASRGGWLAINIALHSQKSVNKLALLSPAQAFTWIRPKAGVLANVTYTMSPKRKNLRSTLETMTYNVDKLEQDYIDQYFIATKEADMSKCILQMTPFSDKQLESLTMPVLILIGDNDIINDDKSLESATKHVLHAKVGTIQNAGHFLSFDQPEEVDKRVLDFLGKKEPEKKSKKN